MRSRFLPSRGVDVEKYLMAKQMAYKNCADDIKLCKLVNMLRLWNGGGGGPSISTRPRKKSKSFSSKSYHHRRYSRSFDKSRSSNDDEYFSYYSDNASSCARSRAARTYKSTTAKKANKGYAGAEFCEPPAMLSIPKPAVTFPNWCSSTDAVKSFRPQSLTPENLPKYKPQYLDETYVNVSVTQVEAESPQRLESSPPIEANESLNKQIILGDKEEFTTSSSTVLDVSSTSSVDSGFDESGFEELDDLSLISSPFEETFTTSTPIKSQKNMPAPPRVTPSKKVVKTLFQKCGASVINEFDHSHHLKTLLQIQA